MAATASEAGRRHHCLSLRCLRPPPRPASLRSHQRALFQRCVEERELEREGRGGEGERRSGKNSESGKEGTRRDVRIVAWALFPSSVCLLLSLACHVSARQASPASAPPCLLPGVCVCVCVWERRSRKACFTGELERETRCRQPLRPTLAHTTAGLIAKTFKGMTYAAKMTEVDNMPHI